jgi:hypothetical protein
LRTRPRYGRRLLAPVSESLAGELAKLSVPAEVFMTHLKPRDRTVTTSLATGMARRFLPKVLREGQVSEFCATHHTRITLPQDRR